MTGWILYKQRQQDRRPPAYGVFRLLEEAGRQGITARVVVPGDVDLIVTNEGRRSILLEEQDVDLPDFLIPRMGASTTYFALAVMRHLEQLGVYVGNTARSVEIVKDKLYTYQILAQNKIPIVRTMLAKFPISVDLVERSFGFPVVVKTLSGSQGRGVFLCEHRRQFEDLIAMITTSEGNPHFIIQEFVATSRGRDLRIVVIGGRVVGCMERTAAEDSFKANFSQGGFVAPYPLNSAIEELAIRTAEVLGLDIAGIDLLFADGMFKVCEANSSPGFEGMESCCGVNIAREIYELVKNRIKR